MIKLFPYIPVWLLYLSVFLHRIIYIWITQNMLQFYEYSLYISRKLYVIEILVHFKSVVDFCCLDRVSVLQSSMVQLKSNVGFYNRTYSLMNFWLFLENAIHLNNEIQTFPKIISINKKPTIDLKWAK